ncbi:Zinc finger protein zxdc [Plakobranchus ocellatus]|uniref:Zinc finger protein zxdc n=1 Tax=Plakobranchus ocellatus TaxID=259542 RepID=A0AAV4AM39_9GAST|nr:Zinc finger protein zxdc [Plakobranchus ocellatus]
MVKTKRKEGGQFCILCCSQSISNPKSVPLNGIERQKSEISAVLKMLLPPQDFSALSNQKLFAEPEICAPCFSSFTKIPKTVFTLQSLIGKPLNVQLYKPNRQAWADPKECDNRLLQTHSETEDSDGISSAKKHMGLLKTSLVTPNSINSVKKLKNSEKYVDNIDKNLRNGSCKIHDLSTQGSSIQNCDDKERAGPVAPIFSSFQSAQRRIFMKKEMVNAISGIAEIVHRHKKRHSCSGSRSTKVLSAIKIDLSGKGKAHQEAVNRKIQLLSPRDRKNSKDVKTKHVEEPEETERIRPIRTCVNRNKMEIYSVPSKNIDNVPSKFSEENLEEEVADLDSLTDISASESDEEFIPISTKAGSRQTRLKIKNDGPLKTKAGLNSSFTAFNKLRQQVVRSVNKSDSEGIINDEEEFLDCHSEGTKLALKDLARETVAYTKSAKHHPKSLKINCSFSGCSISFPLWTFLARHIKYFHFNGSFPEGGDVWQKLSMLAGNEDGNGKVYVHKCKQKDCKLAFSSREVLKEHNLCHDNKRIHACGFPDCPKAFKHAQSLKAHFQTHTQSLRFTQNPEVNKSESKALLQKSPLISQSQQTEIKSLKDTSQLKVFRANHNTNENLKCEICGKEFAKEIGLVRHKKRIHGVDQLAYHKCPYQDCDEQFVKKEKLEIHLCKHSPERRLFCEKCGQSFSCQRYLDVHYKIHIKNEAHAANPPSRSIPCEQDGCTKLFTTRENMKSHFLNQHRGRKPRALPGVFFPCTVPGCGKKFSFRSTLYRHKKLVHKGGDYKLGRHVVQYPCSHEGCGKVFNRKNLLEEHLVMEHGKSSPKRLLPLRSRALDFTERICIHCGMVLTVTLLPRHEQLYHSAKVERNLSENRSFPCHLEGCYEVFNTQEDRLEHVQRHIGKVILAFGNSYKFLKC